MQPVADGFKMNRRPTLRDLAKLTGVHYTTVGRALNDDPRISAKTRKVVQTKAKELGYSHDAMLSALSSYRRNDGQRYGNVLAYIYYKPPRHALDRHQTIFSAALRYATANGFKLERFQLDSANMTARRLSNILRARGIQGILFAPLPTPGPLPAFSWSHFSVVALGYTITNLEPHRVCLNQAHSMKLLLRRLRQLGYRRIGLIITEQTNQRTDSNLLGAFLSEQLSLARTSTVHPLYASTISSQAVARWHRKEKPDCVILTEHSAFEYLQAADAHIPRDLGVAIASRMDNADSIAGVDERWDLLGESGVELLITLLRANERDLPKNPRFVLVEGKWVDRPTVRKIGPPVRALSSTSLGTE